MKFLFFLITILFSINAHAMKIDRVILSTDNHPNYIQFWPIVAKAWNKLGIKPTLAFIGSTDVEIDKSVGDVFYFEPIKNIKTSFQAQTIRLLLPALFPNEVCLISDIDMFPLQKEYFQDSIKNIQDDFFVVYRNKAYDNELKKYPMCYVAAKGSTYKEVFKINKVSDFKNTIKKWKKLKLGWNTDELVLYKTLQDWKHFDKKCILLNHIANNRIDRVCWGYDINDLKKNKYIDAHFPRPYLNHKDLIDKFINDYYE